ncbi:hypothetical protein SUGI_0104500 [Cryptomeria japonica]|nr:hypothetical protein SUGI_0104500 [Cryptomeria japonica]
MAPTATLFLAIFIGSLVYVQGSGCEKYGECGLSNGRQFLPLQLSSWIRFCCQKQPFKGMLSNPVAADEEVQCNWRRDGE